MCWPTTTGAATGPIGSTIGCAESCARRHKPFPLWGGQPNVAIPGPSTDESLAIDSSTQASCVERYTPQALRGRAFAFDGTVIELGPRTAHHPDIEVTFVVHEWFRGDGPDEITVDMMSPAVRTSVPAATYDVGSRLLVSGEPRWGGGPLDEPVVWMCGFTRTHNAETAGTWRQVFSTAG